MLPAQPRLLPLLLLPLLAVGVVAWLSWTQAGQSAENELTRRGEALLAVIGAAVQESGRTLSAHETLEAARLVGVARHLDDAIRSLRSPVEPLLRRMAGVHGVGRIFLLDPEGRQIARVVWPERVRLAGGESLGDAGALEWKRARETMDGLGREEGSVLNEGVRPSVFGMRDRLGIALRLRGGGAVLVRADRAALERSRADHGVKAVLRRLLDLPDVVRIGLTTAKGGAHLDVEGRATPTNTIAFTGTATTPQAGALATRLVLSRDRIEQTTQNQRLDILLWAALAASAGIIGLAVFLRTERSARKAEQQRAAEVEGERRLAEMGALAGLFVHEISNPLNAIAIEMARIPATGDDRVQEIAAHVRTQIGKVRETVESYLRLAQSSVEVNEGVYSTEDLTATLDALAAVHAGRRIDLEVDTPGKPAAVRTDPRVFDQALRNLLRNAQEAAGHTGVRIVWRELTTGITIEINDDGPGFPEAVLASQGRLGQSFRRHGHGIGLVLARRFVENQGCQLTLGTSNTGGARATIQVPVSRVHGGRHA